MNKYSEEGQINLWVGSSVTCTIHNIIDNPMKNPECSAKSSRSRIERESTKGSKHHNWKGGRIIDKGTHVWIHSPNHPLNNHLGYVYEHRLVMEKKLGRFLTTTEVVHHLDYNTLNNHLDNLYLFTNNSEHKIYHHMLRRFVKQLLQGEI